LKLIYRKKRFVVYYYAKKIDVDIF